MLKGPQSRSSRYSRPPSLSTISSNEEADFSSSQRHRSATYSTVPISPRELDLHSQHYPPQPPLLRHHQSFSYLKSSAPDVRPIQPQDPVRHWSDRPIMEPAHVQTRPLSFVLPEDDSRPETAVSENSATKVKYMKTRYMWMLLQLDQIPWWHNVLAATAAWIVLAAYLVVPGTFTTISKNPQFSQSNTSGSPQDQVDHFANQIVNSIKNLSLLVFSGVLAGLGGTVCTFLFFLHWQNYAWLTIKIFQPMTLNALAGLLTTIVNVYTAQDGVWSPTAKINAIVTGSVAGFAGSLLILYNFRLLEQVKKDHRKHFPQDAELIDPMRRTRFHTTIGKFLPSQKGYF